MEVRTGGGDRYAASRYLGRSSGVVHGRSSIELLVVCRNCVRGLFNVVLIGVLVVGVVASVARQLLQTLVVFNFVVTIVGRVVGARSMLPVGRILWRCRLVVSRGWRHVLAKRFTMLA